MAHTANDFLSFSNRRKKLAERLRAQHGDDAAVLLCAGFEAERVPFWQDSSFFYLTGLHEPGVMCVITAQGQSVLFVPQFTIDRSVWVDEQIALTSDNAHILGFTEIRSMGDVCRGYSVGPCMPSHTYADLIAYVEPYAQKNKLILCDLNNVCNRAVYTTLCHALEIDLKVVHNISADIAALRRIKEDDEIASIRAAIAVTAHAQHAAAKTIAPGVNEADVRAALEAEMTKRHTRPSFPSIVAAGVQGTILHYTACNKTIQENELVVVDIGASYNGYAADITRTYPASGTCTPRQKELYNLVLEAQTLIARTAQPGYWLNNASHPDKSLNHIARAFFESHGYAQYFPHGIGHYLGLDVHDVGSYAEPLQAGDVITIEPGLYIRSEGIGIRIEDNYLITNNGAECLSAALPKSIAAIESLMLRD